MTRRTWTRASRLLGALDVNDVNLAMERADHQPRTEFARFLRLIKAGGPDRSLYFLHLTLPHAPYRLLPSGHEYGNAETIDGIEDDAFDELVGLAAARRPGTPSVCFSRSGTRIA